MKKFQNEGDPVDEAITLLVYLFSCFHRCLTTGNNPVFGMSVAVLEAEEARIFGMEDPIAAFLTSDEYTAVAPEVEEVYTCDCRSPSDINHAPLVLNVTLFDRISYYDSPSLHNHEGRRW